MANPLSRPLISGPEDLWALAVRYFTWTDANPVVVTQVHGKHSEIIELEKPQPYSVEGFRIHTGITSKMMEDFKKNESLLFVLEKILEIIRKQKYDNALLGVYNSNIFIREYGLADKKQVETTDTKKVVLYLPDNGRSIAAPREDISVTLEIPDPILEERSEEKFDDFEFM